MNKIRHRIKNQVISVYFQSILKYIIKISEKKYKKHEIIFIQPIPRLIIKAYFILILCPNNVKNKKDKNIRKNIKIKTSE